MNNETKLLNIIEVAKIIKVSPSTVRRWADNGILKCYRVGYSRYRKFDLESVNNLAKEYYDKEYVSKISETKLESITNNISAESHPAHYLMHKYWGRKPHNVINEYIKYFTRPGDTVLDPFMGSGVTIIESLKLGRNAVGIDINPMSYFIVKNTVSKVNYKIFETEFQHIYDKVYQKYSYLYETRCPICRGNSYIESAVWEDDAIKRIKGICSEHGTFIKDTDGKDLECYKKCCALKTDLLEKNLISYPTDPIMKYVKRSGRESIDELFSDRALVILSSIRNEIYKVSQSEVRDLLLFCFTSMLSNVSRMLPGDFKKSTYKSGWVISKFWTPKVHAERNIFMCFKLRFKAICKGKKELAHINDEQASIRIGDSTSLNIIKDNSIDYIFTDPPYGESIAYLALSQFWNSWLPGNVDYANEIIIDPYRQKDYADYETKIKAAFRELYRVLKPDSYMSFTFHNRDLNVWKAILDSCSNAGFILESTVLQEQSVSSGTQGINHKNTLTGDFIYNFKKSLAKVDEMPKKIDSPETFIKAKITEYINQNHGVTPSQLYEHMIPIIVKNNAYLDSNNNVINIEKILRDNFKYIAVVSNGKSKIGDGHKWI